MTPIIETDQVTLHYRLAAGAFTRDHRVVRAVSGVSLHVNPGETVGLVGESGCGKSSLGRLLLRADAPTGGRIRYHGTALDELKAKDLMRFRREVSAVFQDPYQSLNPRLTVGASVAEPMEVHGLARGKAKWEQVARLFEEVGLSAAALHRFPHEFSGGQRQRIAIARALASGPRFIVCDEPTSALDISVQAQILNLLMSMQESHGLAYLLITHNLSVVEHTAHRVAVMYLGQIVETAPTARLFASPAHPYTRALLSAAPAVRPAERRERIVLEGETPSNVHPPSGCPFHPRCPQRMQVCTTQAPVLTQLDGGHWVSCHLWSDSAQGAAETGA